MKQKELESYIYTYGRDLYSFCCSVTRSRTEADDLYQDTFLKLYEMGESLEIQTNPKSFLMSVSVNLYRNYKRKLAVRHRITGVEQPVEENTIQTASLEQGPEDLAIQEETYQMLREAVRGLPDRYRLPVLLFYMEDLPLADIAKILKLKQGTVKCRLHRAKKILKQELEDIYYGKEYGHHLERSAYSGKCAVRQNE